MLPQAVGNGQFGTGLLNGCPESTGQVAKRVQDRFVHRHGFQRHFGSVDDYALIHYFQLAYARFGCGRLVAGFSCCA
ncbi:hypothetical protein D3C81_893670 [compost metagenome]